MDSDAAYSVLPNARSRKAGNFHVADKPSKSKHYTDNGSILIECYTFEAETKGVFYNTQIYILIHHKLIAMGHPQDPTPIATDNITTTSFFNYNMVVKK